MVIQNGHQNLVVDEEEAEERGKVRGKRERREKSEEVAIRKDGTTVGVAGRKLGMEDGVSGHKAGSLQQTWILGIKNGWRGKDGQDKLGHLGFQRRTSPTIGDSHLVGKWKKWAVVTKRGRVKAKGGKRRAREKRRRRSARRGRGGEEERGKRKRVVVENLAGDGQNHISSN
jgi:hypothetical protein